jgi:hypothetical protein
MAFKESVELVNSLAVLRWDGHGEVIMLMWQVFIFPKNKNTFADSKWNCVQANLAKMTKENAHGSSSSPSKQKTGQREKELTAMIMDMEAKHGEFLEH